MSGRALTLATANPNKVVELQQLLGDGWVIARRPSDLADTIEDRDTLAGNALKKAHEVSAHARSLAVADDTGLFVDALDGRPGVWTARYAGPAATAEDNVAKLLVELAGVTGARGAHFATVIAAVWPDGTEVVVEGRVDGVIADERRGEGGFGYDPVFVPVEGDGRSFAEMAAEEKNRISHRGRAIQALLDRLA
ncbi:MAG: RdgB/HAM1 family non-canonical purine NTP pyrophosphatase [Actinomycetota bacterium]